MPDKEQKPAVSTEKIEGIPLYLILVERKFHHRYTVKVETFDEHAERVKQENPAAEEGDGHG